MDDLQIAIEAAILGGQKILDIYDRPNFNVKIKDNDSPLTEADTASNEIIHDCLIKTGVSIISEEVKNLEYSV